MAKFGINDILNAKTKAAGQQAQTEGYKEIYLSPYEVKAAQENTHQKLENIEELADSFLHVGQEQPTVLARVNGEYRIIDGHRRNAANILNLERGHKEYEKVLYRFMDMSEAMYELRLLAGNGYTQELTAYAVAGIMGNLYAESGLMPNNLQNTNNNKLGKTDAEYTAAVDNGSYGNFVKDSAGYGLAQWTYWSRKQALLNHAKQAGVSIADLNMQLGFLWEELQGYTAVMDALKKAGSVRAASDAVLTGYEKPADQSETVKKKRAEYGEGYYKKYAAENGTKYYRVRKSWTDAASQLGAFTSLENAKSACKAGYTVYDDNGKAVYTAAGQQASAGVPFSVQVDILDLNIRTGAGTNYAKTGETTGKGVFTIVEVKAGQGASAGWGRLKSGAGWISLDYATRLA